MADTKVFQKKLFGQNYTTPDHVAKVTGKARYAEEFGAEGMLFAKLLVSPMPHAKVKRLDTSKALAIPGVKAIITDDDLPKPAAGATLGENVQATAQGERGLTMEPLYQGEPILAVAAVDEKTAAEAQGASRAGAPGAGAQSAAAPGAPGGRGRGGAGAPPPPQIAVWKWTDEDFRNAGEGQMPTGKATDEWTFGKVDVSMKSAAI